MSQIPTPLRRSGGKRGSGAGGWNGGWRAAYIYEMTDFSCSSANSSDKCPGGHVRPEFIEGLLAAAGAGDIRPGAFTGPGEGPGRRQHAPEAIRRPDSGFPPSSPKGFAVPGHTEANVVVPIVRVVPVPVRGSAVLSVVVPIAAAQHAVRVRPFPHSDCHRTFFERPRPSGAEKGLKEKNPKCKREQGFKCHLSRATRKPMSVLRLSGLYL